MLSVSSGLVDSHVGIIRGWAKAYFARVSGVMSLVIGSKSFQIDVDAIYQGTLRVAPDSSMSLLVRKATEFRRMSVAASQ